MNNVNNLKLRSIAIEALQDQAGVRTNSSSSSSESGFDPNGSNWLPAVEVVGSGKPKGSGSGSGKETDPSLPSDPGPGGPGPGDPGGTGGTGGGGGWPPTFPGDGGENTNPGEGNTGGNGNGHIPTKPVPSTVDPEKVVQELFELNNLKDANKVLIEVVENMLAQHIYKILLEEAKKRGRRIQIIFIRKDLGAVAIYSAANDSMGFESEDAIRIAFTEEFLHFLQNGIYKNGIGQYAGVADSNIEFEAKLIQDICEWLDGNRNVNFFEVVLDSDAQEEYKLYLKSVVQAGTFPTLDSLNKGTKNYNYFLRKFHDSHRRRKNPNSQLKEGMTPELIKEMGNMFK